jgi:hypothetical protein
MMNFIQNVLFFTTAWSAKAAQKRCIGFAEKKITTSCNSCLASVNFSNAMQGHIFNVFAITAINTLLSCIFPALK